MFDPPDQSLLIPWWPKFIVILGAFLTLTGGVLAILHPAMMVSSHDEINGAVRIYAGYLASRNLVVGLMLISLLLLHAWRALSQLMILVAFIQFFDVCMDCIEGRWMIVPGVLIIGILFLLGSKRLSGHPFWNSAAWMN
ncbi:hypothetical protein [Acidisarcina polymorpha]|uniref:hypothetical protein n=1 Tax=Acidisarcina polymorpha TaxID=2211140 RepID=UPI000DEFCDB5|nr:hypothetical protein [Acidisarcina polymorpha]